jgi:hypothetical protein
MLMAPRLIKALVQTLEEEPLLTDGRAVPGGIWRDYIPQDVGRLPGIVISHVLAIPSTSQPGAFDITIEARAENNEASIEPMEEAMDRAEVLLRRASAPPGGFQGINFRAKPIDAANLGKSQEILRTSIEVGRTFGHLGVQVTYIVTEPPLSAQ